MKVKESIMITIIISALVCGPPMAACAQEQKWQFIQSVGGLSVGSPFRGPDGCYLPIECDVSGLEKVTISPTTLNSALACKEVKAEVNGNNIYLTLMTVIGGSDKNARCPAAYLGQISAGEYIIYYLGPDEQPVRVVEVSIVK